MTVKKRDQRQYDLVQQYLPELVLNTMLEIIQDLDDPYEVKPSLGGMTAYHPTTMTAEDTRSITLITHHRSSTGFSWSECACNAQDVADR